MENSKLATLLSAPNMIHIYTENEPMRPEIHKDHLDENSGWLSARYEIVIKRDPKDIWNYVYDPKHWTESNPNEHMGLIFYNRKNRPETGVAFYQKESVSGVMADLRGHILFSQVPDICVWNGVAKYRIIGFIPFRVPEAGVVRLESINGGTLASHTVFLRIPDTFLGRIMYSVSASFSKRPGYIPHTFKELLYFKQKLES